jgi:hypothetical protein
MKYEERESRQSVVDLCKILGGKMINNGTDRFVVNGCVVDLATIHDDYLGKVAVEFIFNSGVAKGELSKTMEIRKALGVGND